MQASPSHQQPRQLSFARASATEGNPAVEHISAIVAALAEGASAQLKIGASKAVKDAYAGLKKLIEARVSAQDVELLEQRPGSKARRAVVEDELAKADAADDPALVEAAERLVNLVKPKAIANVTAREVGLHGDKETTAQTARRASPTRGAIRLDVSTSTTILSSGSDFSIFLNISNPFDIPITIYQVLTHIPVELIDRNTARLVQIQREKERTSRGGSGIKIFYEQLKDRFLPPSPSGVAIAVGNEFNPEATPAMTIGSIQATGTQSQISIGNVHIEMQDTPTPEELDTIFGRIDAARRGVIPVTLQPGDTVVRQFVLRTRSWLFLSPLNYTFNIQVTYSADGIDHSATVAHQVNLRSGMAAISVGAIAGAAMGSAVRHLMTIQNGGANDSMLYGSWYQSSRA